MKAFKDYSTHIRSTRRELLLEYFLPLAAEFLILILCILPFRLLIRGMYVFNKDPKIRLMLEEPHIPDDILRKISAKTLVLAGSHDMVRETETRRIARMIPGAKLYILKGEGHGSYIVHKERIGKIIMKFAGKGTVKKASF